MKPWREVDRRRKELALLLAGLEKPYKLAHTITTWPAGRSGEMLGGGGTSDPTGEMVADEAKAAMRRASDRAYKAIDHAGRELAAALQSLEYALGLRTKERDAAELEATEKRRERQRATAARDGRVTKAS